MNAYDANGTAYIEDNLVTEDNGCPCCGERDIDRLMWLDDDETVECQTCGVRYSPMDYNNG